MKKYYFVLVLIFVVNLLSAQNIPNYVPKDGLVGYWPFNGNANDESGNGNHGTVNGATLTSDRNGKANRAYSFNGVSNYIEIPNNSKFRGLDNISIVAWININHWFNQPGYGDFFPIITQSNNQFNWGSFELGFGYTNKIVSHLFKQESFFDVNVNLKQWNFITVTISNDSTSYFINGIKIFSALSGVFTQIPNDNMPIQIGRNIQGLGEYSNGYIDDISIYNRALSDNEVQTLYTGSPCAAQINRVLQPTCFFKTGQIDLKAHIGNYYSYSLDGKNYTADTTFRDLAPGAYTVFVKHTSGCMDSTSVTIQPVPTSLTATTTPAGPLKICEGSSIKLASNTGKNYTYQWFKDKVAIQGATASTYEAKKAGQYTVFVNDGACSNTSTALTVDTILLPDGPKINNNYLQVCDMMPLEEVCRKNQIDRNYKWYRSETGTDSLQKYEQLKLFGSMQYYLSQFSATNPACESKKRTMIQVEMLESPKISYPGTSTFCQGDSIKLETNSYFNNPWDYVWMKDYSTIPGTNGKTSLVVKETGNYSVSNQMCMYQGNNQNMYITFNPAPDTKITYTGSTILPVGGSLTLTVTDKAGNNYEWYKNGTLIQGASANSYLVKEIGKYSVKVTNGTCSSSSIPVDVTGTIDPKPVLTNTGKKTFCSGDSTTLKVDAINAVFEWLKDGQTIKGAVNASFVAKQTGIYSVKVTKNNVAQTTDTLHITVFDNPKVDIKDISTNIQQEIPTFVLKNQKSIQLLGIPSGGKFSGQGITNSVFNPSTLTLGKKLITYSFTSLQGCNGTASRATIVVDSVGNVCNVTNTIYDTILKLKFKLTTGLQANKMASISVYPNPTSDVLQIEVGDAKSLDGYRYRIVDALGKEVYNELVKTAITGIPMKTLGAAGMYQFEVLDQKNVRIQTNKILLQ